jgi:hypothetical protein
LKGEYSQLNSEKIKGQKVIQISEEDIKKLKNDQQTMVALSAQREKEYEEVKN